MTNGNKSDKLTSKVKRYNVGLYQGPPPPEDASDAKRKISGARSKPLYPVNDVIKLIDQAALEYWTRDCARDVRNLELAVEDTAELVRQAVTLGTFKGSVWCDQKPKGPCAACDSYVLRRMEWNKAANKELLCEYYVKFAISKTGTILLLVSCHV